MKMKTTRWTDTVRIGQRNTISLDAVPVGTTLMTTSDQTRRTGIMLIDQPAHVAQSRTTMVTYSGLTSIN